MEMGQKGYEKERKWMGKNKEMIWGETNACQSSGI